MHPSHTAKSDVLVPADALRSGHLTATKFGRAVRLPAAEVERIAREGVPR
jgi:predicted RNA-binding protein associated with RNAse of E/G family